MLISACDTASDTVFCILGELKILVMVSSSTFCAEGDSNTDDRAWPTAFSISGFTEELDCELPPELELDPPLLPPLDEPEPLDWPPLDPCVELPPPCDELPPCDDEPPLCDEPPPCDDEPPLCDEPPPCDDCCIGCGPLLPVAVPP